MSPVRASIRFVGGLAYTWGCFGVGSRRRLVSGLADCL